MTSREAERSRSTLLWLRGFPDKGFPSYLWCCKV